MDQVIERVRMIIAQSGLTQADFAEEIGIDATKLSKSLNGKRQFTSSEFAEIANIGKRTVDWILSGVEPRAFAFAYRAQLDDPEVAVDAGVRAVSAIVERFDSLRALNRAWPATSLPVFRKSGRFLTEGNQLAGAALDAVGSDLRSLGTGDLIDLVEAAFGVIVIIIDLPDGCDGLSYSDDDFRIIVLARTGNAARQRFTLAHELGHILAGDAEGIYIQEAVYTLGVKTYEDKRADVFAAAFLMPAQEIRDSQAGRSGSDAFDDLVMAFRVSPRSMAYRLLNLKILTDDEQRALGASKTFDIARRTHRVAEQVGVDERAMQPRPPRRLVLAYVDAYLDGLVGIRPVAQVLNRSVEEVQQMLERNSRDQAAPLVD